MFFQNKNPSSRPFERYFLNISYKNPSWDREHLKNTFRLFSTKMIYSRVSVSVTAASDFYLDLKLTCIGMHASCNSLHERHVSPYF